MERKRIIAKFIYSKPTLWKSIMRLLSEDLRNTLTYGVPKYTNMRSTKPNLLI
ncbi:hypothetical protein SPHINGO8BC_50977 [Sphingobacterium multivorum]|uniref:Uncharacterized protein n=1 Tax=Sphingobacterium multivorum TaxID=28454 RepID=A0A654CJ80_SPHMU|nr:hypothetical protein SPHINGO8BC_50977 [Sphingobacterium multivorum]